LPLWMPELRVRADFCSFVPPILLECFDNSSAIHGVY
jgi:hypothetical protein